MKKICQLLRKVNFFSQHLKLICYGFFILNSWLDRKKRSSIAAQVVSYGLFCFCFFFIGGHNDITSAISLLFGDLSSFSDRISVLFCFVFIQIFLLSKSVTKTTKNHTFNFVQNMLLCVNCFSTLCFVCKFCECR